MGLTILWTTAPIPETDNSGNQTPMSPKPIELPMQSPVTRSELLDIAEYEKKRPSFREEVMAAKALRRVMVGQHFNFVFENHVTVLYQIQEMMRVERIVEESAIEHEVSTYNSLIPPAGGLSATLLIEYVDATTRAENLPKLLGIENHVWLHVGALPPLAAEFEQSQIGEARISSVQYVEFPLSEAHRAGWQEAAEAGTLKLVVDHPHYSEEAVISPEVARALAEDFS